MGYYAGVSADVDALTEHSAAPLAQDAPVGNAAVSSPLTGYVWRNGRALPFTLETTAAAAEWHDGLPEQLLIAALLLVSFVAPIFHLLG